MYAIIEVDCGLREILAHGKIIESWRNATSPDIAIKMAWELALRNPCKAYYICESLERAAIARLPSDTPPDFVYLTA